MEIVRYVTSSGATLLLTDYPSGFAMLGNRRGWEAPPVQVFHERVPDAPGARYIGTVTRERTVSFRLTLRSTGHENALAGEAFAVDILTQDGYLESIANGVTRRLDVAFKGGLDGDTSARQGGSSGWPVLIPQYETKGYPYWYDPTAGTAPLDLATVTAPVLPITLPVFWTSTGVAGLLSVAAGTVGGPWTATVAGPFGGVEISHPASGRTMFLDMAIPAGESAIFSTFVGETQVWRDRPTGKTRVTDKLSIGSSFWLLQGGTNLVGVRIVPATGSGANRAAFTWPKYYRAPGA